MPRQNQREELTAALHSYLTIAEVHPPETYPLDCRSVAKALGVSPTTLYKYQFQESIRKAEQRQREQGTLSGKSPRHDASKEQLRRLQGEVKQAEERNKHLVARLALVEANAARLGLDPEELHRPVLQPMRSVSHAGKPRAKSMQQGIYELKREI